MVLSELKKGQIAVIENFENLHLALKFMEIGLVPGAEVSVYSLAPLGDPIAIEIEGSKISMRKKEAATVKIKLI
jgi:ferrous iron transport protein A